MSLYISLSLALHSCPCQTYSMNIAPFTGLQCLLVPLLSSSLSLKGACEPSALHCPLAVQSRGVGSLQAWIGELLRSMSAQKNAMSTTRIQRLNQSAAGSGTSHGPCSGRKSPSKLLNLPIIWISSCDVFCDHIRLWGLEVMFIM